MTKQWRRHIRRSPPIAWREFTHPIANRGQAWLALLALIGLRLIATEATFSERVVLATEWALWFQAFGYTCILWATLSILRAPFLARAEDKAKGEWVGDGTYILNEPLLLRMFRFTATERMDSATFKVPFVEPKSFVTFAFEFEPPGTRKRAEIWIEAGPASPTPNAVFDGAGIVTGDEFRTGLPLPRSRQVTLYVKLERHTRRTTVKVYCCGFVVGPNDD